MKDHSSFLHAASLLVRERKGIRFVCVGKDNPPLSGELKGLSKELELGKILSWTGSRTDMKAVYNGIDILTSSSSFGEGFPNVIGEAMACSRICVVTDVGDSSFIVGKTGEVVPPGDPHALADAWKKMMGLSPKERQTQGEKARKRVLENFTIECLVKNTAEHILSILARF